MKPFAFVFVAVLVFQVEAFSLEHKDEVRPEKICRDCKELNSDIKEYLGMDNTKNITTTEAVILVCGPLGETFADICEFILKSTIPPILQFASDIIEPEALCIEEGLCLPPPPPPPPASDDSLVSKIEDAFFDSESSM